jgi:hypothetical protein
MNRREGDAADIAAFLTCQPTLMPFPLDIVDGFKGFLEFVKETLK